MARLCPCALPIINSVCEKPIVSSTSSDWMPWQSAKAKTQAKTPATQQWLWPVWVRTDDVSAPSGRCATLGQTCEFNCPVPALLPSSKSSVFSIGTMGYGDKHYLCASGTYFDMYEITKGSVAGGWLYALYFLHIHWQLVYRLAEKGWEFGRIGTF